jgi:hypothetical protein
MNITGEFRVWGTSTGMVACKLQSPTGSTQWELTPEGAEDIADQLKAHAAWVRRHAPVDK